MALAELFGPVDLDDGEGLHLAFGPLRVAVWRSGDRLLTDFRRGDEHATLRSSLASIPDAAGAALVGGEANVRPVLPDRALVVRPETPTTLAPHSELSVWVGLPVWLALSDELWFQVDVPKLTWFGPSMSDGELAYAGRTRLRARRDATSSSRAECNVILRNEAETPLVLDRVRIPLPRLGLSLVGDLLQADSVTLTHDGDEGLAHAQLTRLPNPVSPPRHPPPEGPIRVFSALIPRWTL